MLSGHALVEGSASVCWAAPQEAWCPRCALCHARALPWPSRSTPQPFCPQGMFTGGELKGLQRKTASLWVPPKSIWDKGELIGRDQARRKGGTSYTTCTADRAVTAFSSCCAAPSESWPLGPWCLGASAWCSGPTEPVELGWVMPSRTWPRGRTAEGWRARQSWSGTCILRQVILFLNHNTSDTKYVGIFLLNQLSSSPDTNWVS